MNTNLQTPANLLAPFRTGFPMMVDSLGTATEIINFPGFRFGRWWVKPDSCDIPETFLYDDERTSDMMYPPQELPEPDSMLYPMAGGEGLMVDACGYPSQYVFLPGRIWVDMYGGLPYPSNPLMLKDPRSSHQLYR